MRTNFRFLMAAAVLVAGFTNCSNDDDANAPNEGKTAGLKIAIPVVKAYADNNATTAEQDFYKATVFVFNGGALEKDTTIMASGFVKSGDKYVMSDLINVLSGTKNVYVGLNMTTADIAAVRSGLQASYTVDAAAISSKTTGFVMFSTNKNNELTIDSETENTIDVEVERWAGKVTTCVSADINSEASGAQINTFTFCLGQVNTKMYPFQKPLASGVIGDPNWSGFATTGGTYGPSDFVNEFGSNASITSTAYEAVDATTTDVANRKAKYALENTSSLAKQGEVTYISIRAAFTPKAYHTYASDALAKESYSGSVPASLHVVETATGETYYFRSQAEATAYNATLTGATINTYNDGLCYYFVFLDANNAANPYATLRNTCFNSLITKVNSLGYPNPGVPDPDKPLSKHTKLEVNVSIKNWELAPSLNELGKI